MSRRPLLPWLLLLMLASVRPLEGATADDEAPCASRFPEQPPLEGWRMRTGDDPSFARPALDDRLWTPVKVPSTWEDQGFGGWDGFAWYRVHFQWSGERLCRPLGVRLGTIDDVDETWFNGVLIGRTGRMPPDTLARPNVQRIYYLPDQLLHPGDNVVAIRVFDTGGPGGMTRGIPRIGDLQSSVGDLSWLDVIPIVAPFLFVLVGFYHLLLFRYRPAGRQNAYFFGFTLGIAAVVFNRSQLPAMLHLAPRAVETFNWLGTCLSPPLLLAFIQAHFQRRWPKWLVAPVGILALVALLSLLFPELRFWRRIFFYAGQPAILMLIVHVMATLVRAAIAGQRDARLLIGGFTLLGLTVTVEIAASLSSAAIPSLIPSGLTLFILFVVSLMASREARRSVELEAAAGALRDLNQTLEGQVADRTEHLEAARRELEVRNETLAEFNALVSHDLKAPMRGLEVIADFLETDYRSRLDEEGNRLLDLIRDSTRQMRSLLDGLLTLARLDQGNVSMAVPLEPVIEAVQGLLAGQMLPRGAVVRVEGTLPIVNGNRTWLLEVFSNLVSNGLKYNRSERPEVVVRRVEPVAIGPEALKPGEVCVAVIDNGIGVAKAYQAQIFEPFKRLHSGAEFEGTGIGLSIVRKALKSMNGRIWVESELGKGTTFYLVFLEASGELSGS